MVFFTILFHQLSRFDAFDTWMGTTQDLEDTVYSPRKSEEPLVVHRFLTW